MEVVTGTGVVSLVIPAYNESASIAAVIERLDALERELEVIVVDDGSVDDTLEIVERHAEHAAHVRVLRHERNRGKGAAVRTGIAASTGQFVVIQDADLEYDSVDIPKLLGPLDEGVADVVYGTRLRGGEPQRAHMFWHLVGNRLLSLLTNVL